MVLDTNALVRAHPRSRAFARHLLNRILPGGSYPGLVGELISETIRVLRYPRLQRLYRLTDRDLLEYAQFLHDAADIVILQAAYSAPVRDPGELMVLRQPNVTPPRSCAQTPPISSRLR